MMNAIQSHVEELKPDETVKAMSEPQANAMNAASNDFAGTAEGGAR